MKFSSDIDIDFGDREAILSKIEYIKAARITDKEYKRHPTGIYPTDIPYNPINDLSALDYKEAERRGYIKLDFLNVWVYKHVKNEEHLKQLMHEPDWSKLYQKDFFEKLIHIGKHYDVMKSMPESICDVESMAMFLALIRPAAKHLVGKSWQEISKEIWNIKTSEDGYAFKKAHAISYSYLVIIHMNLLNSNSI